MCPHYGALPSTYSKRHHTPFEFTTSATTNHEAVSLGPTVTGRVR